MVNNGLRGFIVKFLLFFLLPAVVLGVFSSSVSSEEKHPLNRAINGTRNEVLSHPGVSGKKFKILHIMSYHSPWEWTDDLTRGFMDQLKGLDVELRTFEMDTKRNSSEDWKQKVAMEAMNLIHRWKPDLVYTTDDNAQKYVAKHYVNTRTPFLFSAVNDPPENYGFEGSTNITGVLEREHFIETINLLRKIAPNIKKIAVIVDSDPTWTGVVGRMKEQASTELPDLEFVSWDIIDSFDEYKRKVLQYQENMDALGLLGIHTFKDNRDTNVPWQEVLRWTAENSRLPDFSFWKDRISYGTLCAVYVSGYEQGYAAGRIARDILQEGRNPSSFPMQPTRKGEPIVSLARAKRLGIALTSEILLAARVVRTFGRQEGEE